MKVTFEYEQELNGIIADVLRCKDICEEQQQKALEQIGKSIKKNVIAILPKSDRTGAGYKHMKDDVKVTINGKRKKTGVTGVIVHGGKLTAYKWHMLDDGTRNPDGTIHIPALHFTTKALAKAEGEINDIIDQLERRIVQ